MFFKFMPQYRSLKSSQSIGECRSGFSKFNQVCIVLANLYPLTHPNFKGKYTLPRRTFTRTPGCLLFLKRYPAFQASTQFPAVGIYLSVNWPHLSMLSNTSPYDIFRFRYSQM